MIELHTLGDAMIKVGDREIRPTSPMLFAALLYLCVERGRRVPRTALQELLFPEADERSGTHSLRQLLYKLRRLGVPFDGDDGAVLLPRSAVVYDALSDREVALLPDDGVLAGVLPGFHPPSNTYRDWFETVTATFTTSVLYGLIQRMARHRNLGDYATTHRFCLRILALDPLNEEATLALAEVLAMTGKKMDAVRVLSEYSAEVNPSGSALQLATSTLKRRLVDIVCSNDVSQTPFVGRRREIAALCQQLGRAMGGAGTVSVLWGDAGIGKTRLLQEFEKHALLRGARCFWAHCRENDIHRPLGAFLDMVPTLLAEPGALGVSPASMRLLKRLEGSDRVPVTAMHGLEAVAASIRGALTDLISSVASERTVVLLIEDAHWLDDVSLRLLLSVLPAEQTSLHILLTFRGEPHLARFRLPPSVFLTDLQPLAHADAAELLSSLLERSTPIPEAMQAHCLALAGGNPLFLCTLVEHLRWNGERQPTTSDVSELLRQRTRVLSPSALLMLRTVALLGRHCSVSRLSAVTGLRQDELLLTLQQLADASLVVRFDDLLGCCHELLEQAVMADMPEAILQALHERVAHSLQNDAESHREASLVWSCAEHWEVAGNRSRATRAFRRCADIALELGQPLFACHALERALMCCSDADRLDILELSATVARLTDDSTLIIRCIGRLRSAMRSASRPFDDHSQLELDELNAIRRSGRCIWGYRERLHECATSDTASLVHRLDAARYFLYAAEQQLASRQATAFFDSISSALATAADVTADDSIEGPRSLWLQLEMIYHGCFGSLDHAVERCHRLLQVSENSPVEQRFPLLTNVGIMLLFAGEMERSMRIFQDVYTHSRKLGIVRRAVDCAAYLSSAHYLQGDTESAAQWHGIAEETCKDGWVDPPLYHLGNCIELAIWNGDAATARRLLESTRQSYPDIGAPYPSRTTAAFDILIPRLEGRLTPDLIDLDRLRLLDEQGRCMNQHSLFALAINVALKTCGLADEARDRLRTYVREWRRERHRIPPYLLNALAEDGVRMGVAPREDVREPAAFSAMTPGYKT